MIGKERGGEALGAHWANWMFCDFIQFSACYVSFISKLGLGKLLLLSDFVIWIKLTDEYQYNVCVEVFGDVYCMAV